MLGYNFNDIQSESLSCTSGYSIVTNEGSIRSGITSIDFNLINNLAGGKRKSGNKKEGKEKKSLVGSNIIFREWENPNALRQPKNKRDDLISIRMQVPAMFTNGEISKEFNISENFNWARIEEMIRSSETKNNDKKKTRSVEEALSVVSDTGNKVETDLARKFFSFPEELKEEQDCSKSECRSVNSDHG